MLAVIILAAAVAYTSAAGVTYELCRRAWPDEFRSAGRTDMAGACVFWPILALGLLPVVLAKRVATLTGRVCDRRALPPARTVTPPQRLAGVVPDRVPGAYLDNVEIYSGRPSLTEDL